jgi:transcriptional regulator with XRE-family HTH domain
MGDERSANNIDKMLGHRVRSRRLEIGMSQEKLADLLGITFQQVQKYEKGVNRIAASRLFEISSALDMPIESFFAGVGETKKRDERRDDKFSEALATSEGNELMRLFASIKSIKVKRRVVELVRAMAADG